MARKLECQLKRVSMSPDREAVVREAIVGLRKIARIIDASELMSSGVERRCQHPA